MPDSTYFYLFSCSTSQQKHLELPPMSCPANKLPQAKLPSNMKVVPLVQVQSFAQLLENIHRIEVTSSSVPSHAVLQAFNFLSSSII